MSARSLVQFPIEHILIIILLLLEDARGFSGVKLMLEKPINNNSVGSEILQWPEFTRSIFEQA